MDTPLTDRYLDAVSTSLPAETREDLREELRASIRDEVEARTGGGVDPADAERQVITELGDPAVLAARYADRPLFLIGPRHFMTWKRLLTVLLAIVPACAVLGVALATTLSGARVMDVVLQALEVGLAVTIHLVFWVTLVFAILERTGAQVADPWDPSTLPEPRSSRTGVSDLVAELVVIALAVAALAWDRANGLSVVGGEVVPVLDPALWPAWGGALLALLGIGAVVSVAVFLRRRWTAPLALANTLVDLAMLAWVFTLASRSALVNPDLVDLLSAPTLMGAEAVRVIGILLGFVFVGVLAWDIVEGWLKARRDAR